MHGSGLPARDREGLNIPLRLKLNPAPRGLVAVWPPPPVSPGDTIAVAAQVQGLPDAHVELLDPAGQVVDSAVADRAGRVRLRGLARAPGQVLFAVRVGTLAFVAHALHRRGPGGDGECCLAVPQFLAVVRAGIAAVAEHAVFFAMQ
ncbi:Putative membrane protein [Xanthomonas citri pv. fuscans]|nr:Putative membrane protein [Xanthomonas citri pv. fuscans]